MRRSLVLLALAFVLGACAGNSHAKATATTAETHTLSGTFNLQGSAAVGTEVEDPDTPNENFTTDKDLGVSGNRCFGTNGYDDIAAGLQVVVNNESGTVIGTGQLGQGEVVKEQFNNVCRFSFSVPNLPVAKFYKVAVGTRGEQSFSYDEMQANGWNIGLTLG